MSWSSSRASREARAGYRTSRGTWSRRRALAALAALPACGFTPVYGPTGAARGLSGEIAVDPPEDEGGYLFVRELETRLGRATTPRYTLSADIRVVDEELGRTPSGDITRMRLNGVLLYQLRETETNRLVKSGRIRSFTSYASPVVSLQQTSIAGNPLSVDSASRDALERLVTILADGLVDELLATSPDWRR